MKTRLRHDRIPVKPLADKDVLTRYFREVAPLTVLKAGEEVAAARKMEQAHLDAWKHLLGQPKLVELVVASLSARITNPGDAGWMVEAGKLVRAAAKQRDRETQASAARFDQAVNATAEQLHRLDTQQTLVAQLLADLQQLPGVAAALGQPRRGDGQASAMGRSGLVAFVEQAKERIQAAHQARSDFISSNLRLVIKFAKRYRYGSMPLVDLIQEGNLGLIEAVRRFDYRRGCRFSTYATWWIRHAICRALAQRGRLVAIPPYLADTQRKVRRVRQQLSARLGQAAPIEQVASEVGLDLEQVYSLDADLNAHEVRLDHEYSDGLRYGDLIADSAASEPLEEAIHQDASQKVLELVEQLGPVEADIVRRRFGIHGREPQTLREIAREYNLSRERIRQIEHKGLRLLRQRLMRRPIRAVEPSLNLPR